MTEFMDFNYTKATGTASKRTMLVISKPSNNYFGIDLSEMSPDEFMGFGEKYHDLQRDYLNTVAKLLDEYDLNHNYRQFNKDKMTEIDTYNLLSVA